MFAERPAETHHELAARLGDFAESTELPAFAPKPLSVSLRRLARRVVPAGCVTALPTYLQDNRSANIPVIAHRDHAALWFTFDTSTHSVSHVTAPWMPRELEDALADLRTVAEEAEEEGYPLPTQLAQSNAGRILRQMYARLRTRLEVYPTQDGEVAVVAAGGPHCSVMVLCESRGSALCLVNMDGEHRRARYSTATHLPDGFLRDALEELAHRG